MIKVKDNLYPKENIKNISISKGKDSFVLTYYFKEDTKLRPVSEIFVSEKDFNKRIDELQGKKERSLFG